MNNAISVSRNPAYMVPSHQNNDAARIKQEGVDIGQGNFAYCYQDENLVNFDTCEEMVDNVNNLPDLSLWGMDDHPQFAAPTAEQAKLTEQWDAVSPLQNTLDKFDRQTTSLDKIDGARGASDNYQVTDQNGNTFSVSRDQLGRGVTVSQDGQKLELAEGDLASVADLMETGAKNNGTLEQHQTGIDAVKAEAAPETEKAGKNEGTEKSEKSKESKA